MADTPIASRTPPRAWLISLLLRDALEAATDESFTDAQRISLREVEAEGESEEETELVGRIPFEHAERIWLRLATRKRNHPWRTTWLVEVHFEGALTTTRALLSSEHPVVFTLAKPLRIIRVAPLLPSDFTRHEPLPLCERVPLQDVAFDCRTTQSSADGLVNAFTAMNRWMTPTRAEPRPWWELDTGAAHYIERIVVHGLEPVPGRARVHVYTNLGPDGEIAAATTRALALDGSLQTVEIDAVGRHVRIEILAPEGQPVSLMLRAVEIEAAPLAVPSLIDNLRRSFTLFADRPLFSHRERVGGYQRWLSYREVWTRALAFANGLAQRLEPSRDRIFVGICASGRAEWSIADIACVARNYVVVPLAHTDGIHSWRHIVDQCRIRAIVCSPDHVAAFIELAQQCRSVELIVEMSALAHEQPAGVREPDGVTHLRFTALEQRGAQSAPLPFAPRDGRELYSVLYTSGSTGAPKAAMRSHDAFNAMVSAYSVVQPAIHLSHQPLSHLSERMGVPVLIHNGGQIGFASGDPSRLFEDVAKLQPTFFNAVPRVYDLLRTHYHALQDELTQTQALASLRALFGPRLQAVFVGSAAPSPALLEFLRVLFAGCWVVEGYGTTEVGTIAIDGVIPPEVDVRLVDVPELGYFTSDDPPRGEICVRTPHMISGYWSSRPRDRAELAEHVASEQRFDSDGYFHTGDIGQRNANGTIQILGRRDHVTKLAQGEFVVPEQIEQALLGCPRIDQIHVHARPLEACVVAIVIPNKAVLREHSPESARAQILEQLRTVGSRAGLRSFELPAAIALDPEPMTVANGLLTSSHKPNRRAIERHYQALLDQLYQQTRGEAPSLLDVVASSASALFGDVSPDADLAQLAIDSLAGVQLVALLRERLQREIPLDAWFAASSLSDLAKRLDDPRSPTAVLAQARADLDRPLPFDATTSPLTEHPHDYRSILLTGATGFLGRGLLEALISKTTATITCLIRAPTITHAEQRLREHVTAAGIEWTDEWRARVQIVLGDLAAPSLGLSPAQWTHLARSIDAILHAGAAVNWLMLYGQLRPANVLGTVELLRLATHEKRKTFHFVSTISTAAIAGDERSLLSESQALAGSGYGASKWIAEVLVRRAAELGVPTAIYRPGMIAAHSTRGHANFDDFTSRYVRGCMHLGLHLDLDAKLDMTPVDFVSEAIVALSRRPDAIGDTHHLVNLEQSPSYRSLGEAMRRTGVAVRPADYPTFRAALLSTLETRGRDGNPLLPLLSYFPAERFSLHMGPWPNTRTREQLERLGLRCPAIDAASITAYLSWLQRESSDSAPAS